MTGSPKVIAAINAALASELRAMSQYKQDAAVLVNANLESLAKYFSDFAGQEETHYGELLERITFLNGRPVVQATATDYRESIEEILTGNLALELQARNDYQVAVELAVIERDYVSRALFEDTEGDEEKHINFLEGEIALFRELGEVAYTSAWKARG